jgi:predicted transcriptional regulator
MSELLTPTDIERLVRQLGIPIAEVCRRAGAATSIFARWKAGKTEPNPENYRRIRDVVVAAGASEPPPAAPKSKAKRSARAIAPVEKAA